MLDKQFRIKKKDDVEIFIKEVLIPKRKIFINKDGVPVVFMWEKDNTYKYREGKSGVVPRIPYNNLINLIWKYRKYVNDYLKRMHQMCCECKYSHVNENYNNMITCIKNGNLNTTKVNDDVIQLVKDMEYSGTFVGVDSEGYLLVELKANCKYFKEN